MKRTLVPLLLVASVTLAGCATIRAHNPFRHREPAYTSAQQERPLEVPPGMEQPPTTNALVIPSAGAAGATAAAASTPAASGAQPGTTAPPGQEAATASAGGIVGSTLTFADTPANTYHRVGLALARGDVGQVTAHDDAAHTYQVVVDTVVTEKPQGGFFHRMFHRDHKETVKGSVTVSVVPQGAGSVVEASGDPAAAARVMAMLQQRLK